MLKESFGNINFGRPPPAATAWPPPPPPRPSTCRVLYEVLHTICAISSILEEEEEEQYYCCTRLYGVHTTYIYCCTSCGIIPSLISSLCHRNELPSTHRNTRHRSSQQLLLYRYCSSIVLSSCTYSSMYHQSSYI